MQTTSRERSGPLEGIKVLDLGQAGVGPHAAGLIAQLGADVIKCEPPGGDIINRSGGNTGDGPPSRLYISTNLAKRGIVLDLKQNSDRSKFLRLAATIDVYMDNMKADTAEHLGIGYEVLSALNPRLIWVNSSGFGARGPLKEMGSFEQYSDAFAGVSSITGERDGPARRLSQLRIDPFTACCLVTMVLAGLVARERTGRGQKIVGSQFQSSLQMGMVRSLEALNLSEVPRPMGTEHPHFAPSGLFRAKDGYIAVSAVTDHQWRNLCLTLDARSLVFDPRFLTNARRVEHRDELNTDLARFFSTRLVSEWVEALQIRRVPAGPVLRPEHLAGDPHVIATEMLRTIDTHWGPITTPGMPVRFSRTPVTLRPGPRRGEHTDQVFAELGEPD